MTSPCAQNSAFVLAGAFTAALLFSHTASAATVSCTITSSQTTTYGSTQAIDSPGNPAGDCFDGGAGNINGSSNDAFLDAHADEGYFSIAKLDYGQTSSGFQVTGNFKDSKSGTWTIAQSIIDQYDSLVLGLKAGNTWATILLTDGVLTGDWSTSRGISHINLYGVLASAPPTPTPLPGALPLLASVLGVGGWLGYRRRRSQRTNVA